MPTNMRKGAIVFLDIDGTLIQPNQRPNTSALPAAISRLAEQGILFALNSNRSLEDVLPIYKKFSLNGPLVLENGVYMLRDGKPEFLVKNPVSITSLLLKEVRDFAAGSHLDTSVKLLDTVRLIKSPTLKKRPLVIAINKNRRYTGSIHIFRYGKHDGILAQKLVSHLQHRLQELQLDFRVESPKAFGNVVLWPSTINKGKAMAIIKNKYYKRYNFYMVGDDIADTYNGEAIKGFFAVGNAQNEVKAKADYVAKSSYTKGVVEILEYFERCLITT